MPVVSEVFNRSPRNSQLVQVSFFPISAVLWSEKQHFFGSFFFKFLGIVLSDSTLILLSFMYYTIFVIIIIIASFSLSCYLVDFPLSLSKSKSPKVFRTFLGILIDLNYWVV